MAVSVCTSNEYLATVVPVLVEQLWNCLLPTTPHHHLEAVRQIWALHTVSSQSRLVESTITSLMIYPGARQVPENEKHASFPYGLHIDAIKIFLLLHFR